MKKIVGGTPTVYIGKLYECTSGGCTKYMLAGTTRLDLNPPAEAKDPQVSLSSISVASDSFAAKVGDRQDVPYGVAQINIIEDTYSKYVLEGEQRAALKASSAICGSDILYYHTDHLGSSNVITNTSGGNIEGIYYYPFGGTRLQTGNDCVNHKFTGQEEDSETGLYTYGARYYDPVLGRFISPDSIIPDVFNPQSLNRYSYVLNNPLKYIDPTGMRNWGTAFGQALEGFWGDVLGYGVDIVGMALDPSGDYGYYGSAIGGAVGSVLGGAAGTAIFGPGVGTAAGAIVGGLLLGQVGGYVGSLLDPPSAGQLNYGENTLGIGFASDDSYDLQQTCMPGIGFASDYYSDSQQEGLGAYGWGGTEQDF